VLAEPPGHSQGQAFSHLRSEQMELFLALLGLGLVAAAPNIPVLRPLAKMVVWTGMAVTEATVSVATVITEQVHDHMGNHHASTAIAGVAPVVPSWLDNTDLLQIDGIGPKVSGHLRNAGIATITQLAVTDAQRLQEILDAAGPRFGAIDSSAWPEQAQALLADGQA
jgi:predicted flap endonuclease-1-like 5' DNA nuclease